ncbi:MAG: carbohydrate kinase family protein [Dehalococcoidia bacterium]|nr:carbohydrate kinase family protein [Dehalococcoidia bacterium]
MTKIDVVGFGAMNIDHLCQVEMLVVDGEQSVKDFVSIPGGSAANTIYGLARLGCKTGFVGAVGADKSGKALINDFDTVAVDTSQIRVKKAETGATTCISDKLGRRAIYVSPGANNLLDQKDIVIAYLNQAKLVHMSSFADDTQLKLQLASLKKLKDSVRLSLAPGMIYVTKGLKALTPLLRKTFVVFMNREEIERLTGKDFQSGASELVQIGCRIVVVTLGKGIDKGKSVIVTAYILDGGKEYEVISKYMGRKSSLETTGAGDAFAAGFLFGLLKGKVVEECGRLGDIVARFAIGKVGARTGLPTLSQLSCEYLKRSGHNL